MRRLTNWRDRLPGMCFPSLVFMAWFCDRSVIRSWGFKVSSVGATGWLSLFSNQPGLPREIFAGVRSHQWLEDNGRKPSDRGVDGEGPRALLSESIAFRFRLAVFTSLTQQSLRPGVPLVYGDIAMSHCTLGLLYTAVTSLGSTQRLKRLLSFMTSYSLPGKWVSSPKHNTSSRESSSLQTAISSWNFISRISPRRSFEIKAMPYSHKNALNRLSWSENRAKNKLGYKVW